MKLHLSPAPHVHSSETTRVLMRNVVIALLPCAIAGILLFGPAVLGLLLASTLSAVLAEFLWQRLTRQKVRIADLSAVVTGLILALNLPPHAPWWLAAVGSAFAVVIVKGLFGGLGDNFINPAMAARALLLVSWPKYMTVWSSAAGWSAQVDTISAATPLVNPSGYSVAQMFLGRIPGSVGEVCKLAILLGLAWLLLTGTVSWRIPTAMVASTFAFSWIFGKDPVASILSGGVLFAAVFMATDYATSPMSRVGQLIYAAGIGLLIAVIRSYGLYPEGVTFAILLMNIATPLIDRIVVRRVYGHEKGAKAQNG